MFVDLDFAFITKGWEATVLAEPKFKHGEAIDGRVF